MKAIIQITFKGEDALIDYVLDKDLSVVSLIKSIKSLELDIMRRAATATAAASSEMNAEERSNFVAGLRCGQLERVIEK